jgi:hypothetical protein
MLFSELALMAPARCEPAEPPPYTNDGLPAPDDEPNEPDEEPAPPKEPNEAGEKEAGEKAPASDWLDMAAIGDRADMAPAMGPEKPPMAGPKPAAPKPAAGPKLSLRVSVGRWWWLGRRDGVVSLDGPARGVPEWREGDAIVLGD